MIIIKLTEEEVTTLGATIETVKAHLELHEPQSRADIEAAVGRISERIWYGDWEGGRGHIGVRGHLKRSKISPRHEEWYIWAGLQPTKPKTRVSFTLHVSPNQKQAIEAAAAAANMGIGAWVRSALRGAIGETLFPTDESEGLVHGGWRGE